MGPIKRKQETVRCLENLEAEQDEYRASLESDDPEARRGLLPDATDPVEVELEKCRAPAGKPNGAKRSPPACGRPDAGQLFR